MKPYSETSRRNVIILNQSICFGLLILHFYKECYWLFDHWHLSSRLTDRILFHIEDTRLLGMGTAKTLIFLFLLLSLFASSNPQYQQVSYTRRRHKILAGLFLYFSSPLIFARNGGPLMTCLMYMVITTAGVILMIKGISSFLSDIKFYFHSDPFSKDKSGFPQEERLLETEFGFNLPATYTYRGREKISWINLVNPRRGTLILGSPGSGKSHFIIQPILKQWMEKGHPIFLYDFKYPSLTQFVWNHFQQYKGKFPERTAFYQINFSDLSHSNRCNVLQPDSLATTADALGAAKTIMLSINKTWVNKQGEFFVESPINFIGALIWFLKCYKNGEYCTLPHVIELSQQPYNELFPILASNEEVTSLLSSFEQSLKNKTFEMLDGQIASAKIPLSRLSSPELYFILTGDDLTLDINNPQMPKILCLAGDSSRQEALAPIVSLFVDQINKICNKPDQQPLALVCDEFATIRAYSMGNTIATARSNNIVPVIAVQDLSQLRTRYSRDEADLFLNIPGNVFCGQVGGETARWISDRFPKIQQTRQSISVNSNDTSVSHSQQWEPTVTPATIAALSSGEFVGLVADEPGMPIDLKTFHANLVRPADTDPDINSGLPIVRKVTPKMIQQQFQQVKQDIDNLIAAEGKKLPQNRKDNPDQK